MIGNYQNPLPGVPLVESPFFADFFDAADPDYQVAKDLNEHGFAVIDFLDADFDAVAEAIKAELGPHFAPGRPDQRVQDAWRENDSVRRIATNPSVIDLLGKLYGRAAFPFQTLNFPMGTEQHFHSDAIHFSSRPERFMCGVWLALEDVGPEQGPLYYYPGSHRWPIYTNEHIGHTFRDGITGGYDSVLERLAEAHQCQPESFHARKGQALIWAANLLHGGLPHKDHGKTRWSQVTHYYFDNCAYYTPLLSNEVVGEYFYRQPIDIVTGKERPGYLNGEPMIHNSGKPVTLLQRGFDAEAYLRRHPDVALEGRDAWEHFVAHGHAEGRDW